MVEAVGLGHWFFPGSWVFRGLHLRVEPGQVLAILGPNGRGKTTLLRCIVGLLRPREGQVRHSGRAGIGYVPQLQQTVFDYSVLDMVLMGRARHIRLGSVPGPKDRRIARVALERVGLAHLAERPFSSLSGGERQLVLIARALTVESPVLVLDEPASALDLRNQGRVLELLRHLSREGLAIVLTTHNPQHAFFVADRALLFFSPEEHVTGPVPDVLSEDRLERLYGIPLRVLALEDGPAGGPVSRVHGVVPLYGEAVRHAARHRGA